MEPVVPHSIQFSEMKVRVEARRRVPDIVDAPFGDQGDAAASFSRVDSSSSVSTRNLGIGLRFPIQNPQTLAGFQPRSPNPHPV